MNRNWKIPDFENLRKEKIRDLGIDLTIRIKTFVIYRFIDYKRLELEMRFIYIIQRYKNSKYLIMKKSK